MTPDTATLIRTRRGRGFAIPRLVLVCLLGSALAGLLWMGLRSHQPLAQEMPRERLTQREGRWYVADRNLRFSGAMVERYENGQIKSRSEIRQGLLEGVSEGWHTNGQKQVTEHFHAGVSHGLRTKWHANGRKLSEATIVEGKMEGTFRRWAEDGTLAEEIEMKAGQPDGISRAYYPGGSVKAEARLRDGALLEQKFWKEGEHQSPPRPPE